ncbi:MAG TPA: phage tail sheath subtilisin-like domain-containing protein [Sphingopyxis sp.]|nr:phage tail sheath subtilisin-like domain-containing protein [Sphingopyxis sp.]
MAAYHHGIRINEITTGTRPMTDISSAVIGLVAISDDAEDTVFPLDTPVLITNLTEAIGKAGVAGTLAPSLKAIADQVIAPVIVVRVEEGADDDATEDNIIGTTLASGARTGLQAMLVAEAYTGQRPRILGVPGYDSKAVATELATVAQQLRAFAYARTIGNSIAELSAYREDFSARELMLIDGEFTDFAGSAIARALGLRAKIDMQIGWHKTISNVGINGVTGVETPRSFSVLSSDVTDASLLNDADITVLARRDGYRFWGNHTCSDEPMFGFESAVRTSHALQDIIAEGLVWAIDKPITTHLIRDIVETVNAKFRSLKAQGLIIGAEAWFDPAANPAEALAAGKIMIDYEYTPCAPAESLTINQRITDKFYGSIADSL